MCEQKIHRNADLKRSYGTQSGVAHIAPTNTHQSDTHIPNTHSSNNNDIIPRAHVQHADSDSNKKQKICIGSLFKNSHNNIQSLTINNAPNAEQLDMKYANEADTHSTHTNSAQVADAHLNNFVTQTILKYNIIPGNKINADIQNAIHTDTTQQQPRIYAPMKDIIIMIRKQLAHKQT